MRQKRPAAGGEAYMRRSLHAKFVRSQETSSCGIKNGCGGVLGWKKILLKQQKILLKQPQFDVKGHCKVGGELFVGHFVIITCEPRRRDFAYSEEKSRFCTNQDKDFACTEEKSRFCTNRRRDFAYSEEKVIFCTNLNEKFTV